MKKIGWLVLSVVLTSSMAFAQQGGCEGDEYHDNFCTRSYQGVSSSQNMINKVQGHVVRTIQKGKTSDVQKVEEQLQQFRRQIHDLDIEDSVAVMQGIVSLANTFLDEVSVNSRTEAFVPKEGTPLHTLVSQINEPIRAGWKSDNFYIAREIEHFLRYRYHEETENMFDESVLEELWVFSNVLKKYPFYADMNYQLRNRLLDFRNYLANASQENMSVIMQWLVFLADDYFEAYAMDPQNKAGRFVVKPELAKVAASVARAIDQEVEVGWARGVTVKPSDYIDSNIYPWDKMLKDKAPAEELDTFTKVLKAARK